jgi:hypothetical protein
MREASRIGRIMDRKWRCPGRRDPRGTDEQLQRSRQAATRAQRLLYWGALRAFFSRPSSLLGPRVTGEEAGLLQRRAERLDVDTVEGTGDAEPQRAGLAGRAAAGDAGDDVVPAVEVEGLERVVHQLLVDLVGEVDLERRPLIVHWPLPGVIRTRAIASLRRPVAAPGPVAATRATEGADSLVYSLISSLSATSALSTAVLSTVVSATVPLPALLLVVVAGRYCATWVISKGTGCCA